MSKPDKFTPGPWTVVHTDYDTWEIRAKERKDFDGLVVHEGSDNGGVCRFKDATLISAAPDMYEALKAIKRTGIRVEAEGSAQMGVLAQIDAAISKAERGRND